MISNHNKQRAGMRIYPERVTPERSLPVKIAPCRRLPKKRPVLNANAREFHKAISRFDPNEEVEENSEMIFNYEEFDEDRIHLIYTIYNSLPEGCVYPSDLLRTFHNNIVKYGFANKSIQDIVRLLKLRDRYIYVNGFDEKTTVTIDALEKFEVYQNNKIKHAREMEKKVPLHATVSEEDTKRFSQNETEQNNKLNHIETKEVSSNGPGNPIYDNAQLMADSIFEGDPKYDAMHKRERNIQDMENREYLHVPDIRTERTEINETDIDSERHNRRWPGVFQPLSNPYQTSEVKINIHNVQPDEMKKQERINMTNIFTQVSQISHTQKEKDAMREGFEIFVANYKGDSPPFTIDAEGNYMMWPDAILFILDHMKPSFPLIKVKKNVIKGDSIVAYIDEEIISTGRQFANYIVTGIGSTTEEGEDRINREQFRDLKKVYDLAYEAADMLYRMFKLH